MQFLAKSAMAAPSILVAKAGSFATWPQLDHLASRTQSDNIVRNIVLIFICDPIPEHFEPDLSKLIVLTRAIH